MPKLRIRLFDTQGRPGETLEFTQFPLVIGRETSNDLVIEDERCSRRHALLDIRDGALWLLDPKSTNGTFGVDGKRLNELKLQGSHRVRIGSHWIELIVEGAVAAAPRASEKALKKAEDTEFPLSASPIPPPRRTLPLPPTPARDRRGGKAPPLPREVSIQDDDLPFDLAPVDDQPSVPEVGKSPGRPGKGGPLLRPMGVSDLSVGPLVEVEDDSAAGRGDSEPRAESPPSLEPDSDGKQRRKPEGKWADVASAPRSPFVEKVPRRSGPDFLDVIARRLPSRAVVLASLGLFFSVGILTSADSPGPAVLTQGVMLGGILLAAFLCTLLTLALARTTGRRPNLRHTMLAYLVYFFLSAAINAFHDQVRLLYPQGSLLEMVELVAGAGLGMLYFLVNLRWIWAIGARWALGVGAGLAALLVAGVVGTNLEKAPRWQRVLSRPVLDMRPGRMPASFEVPETQFLNELGLSLGKLVEQPEAKH